MTRGMRLAKALWGRTTATSVQREQAPPGYRTQVSLAFHRKPSVYRPVSVRSPVCRRCSQPCLQGQAYCARCKSHHGDSRPLARGPPNPGASGVPEAREPCIPSETQRLSTHIRSQSSMSQMQAALSSRAGTLCKVQCRLRLRVAQLNFPKSRLGDSSITLCISHRGRTIYFCLRTEAFRGHYWQSRWVALTADVALCVPWVRVVAWLDLKTSHSKNTSFLDYAARTSSR